MGHTRKLSARAQRARSTPMSEPNGHHHGESASGQNRSCPSSRVVQRTKTGSYTKRSFEWSRTLGLHCADLTSAPGGRPGVSEPRSLPPLVTQSRPERVRYRRLDDGRFDQPADSCVKQLSALMVGNDVERTRSEGLAASHRRNRTCLPCHPRPRLPVSS